MLILVFLFCITSVIVILWYYFKFKQNYWRKLNVKYFQPVPLFGNITKSMLLLNSFHETYHKMYEAMDDDQYAGFYDMNIPTLMVKDLQLISAILMTDFKHFQNRGRPILFSRNKKLNPLSLSVVTSKDERWKFLRQAISPFFTSGKIKHMYEKIVCISGTVDHYLELKMKDQNSVNVELKDLFENSTTNFITSCFFGIEDMSKIPTVEIQRMLNETIEPKLVKTWRTILAAYCPTWLNDLINRAEVSNKVLNYMIRTILDSVEHRRRHHVDGNDMLQSMMNLQNSHVDSKFAVCDYNKSFEPHKKFDEIDIAANSFILLTAGFSTTSATLSYCIYELALSEDIQQNVRLEVQNVKNECGITYDSLKKMTFLDAVIAETLRKYPPTPTISRECCEDYVLPGTEVRLPKGSSIQIPIWSIHHDWRHYANPEKFDPQRFLGTNKNSVKNGTYLPFGDGPRFCLGKRFAEVVLKAAIADLVLKYDIKPCGRTEIPIKFKKGSTALLPENGIWVNITRRKNLNVST